MKINNYKSEKNLTSYENKPILLAALLLCFQLSILNLFSQEASDLDPSFGTEGIVTTDFGVGNEAINGIAIQPDGKLVAAGFTDPDPDGHNLDFALARYNNDGSLDSSFGTNGKVTTSIGQAYGDSQSEASSLALQSDGKILVAGYAFVEGKNDVFALVRYDSDGSLDNSFGSGGKVTTDFGNEDDHANAIVLQPDGKIILAGHATSPKSNISGHFALARYNRDGSLDSTFGTGGKVITDFGQTINAVTLQPDGKIIAVGSAINDSGNRTYYEFAVARYNPDGSLDASFGTDGTLMTPISSQSESATAVVLQADGKILVSGLTNASYSNMCIIRYNSDGSVDNSFGKRLGRNVVNRKEYNISKSMVLQSNGKIILGGMLGMSNKAEGYMVRFNADGLLDNDFGDDGKLVVDYKNSGHSINSMVLQPDGEIVVGGTVIGTNDSDFFLARFYGDKDLGTEKLHRSKPWINIYPNPSNGRFFIETETNISNVTITNMLGQKVENPSVEKGDRRLTIDIGKEQSGVYFLTLTTEKGVLTKKMIVQ